MRRIFFFSLFIIISIFTLHTGGVWAQSGDGVLTFDPATKRVNLNATFPVTIKVDTRDDRKVNVAQLSIVYPADIFSLVSCTAAPGYQGIAGRPPCQGGNGILQVNVQSTNAEGNSHVVPLAVVTLKAIKEGSDATLMVEEQQIVVKDTTGASVLLGLGSIGQATYQVGAMQLVTPSPGDAYRIAIGTTNSLTIQIGSTGPTATTSPPTPTSTNGTVPANTPYLRFGISLFGVENTPEIRVSLRLADLVAQLTPPVDAPVAGSVCKTPGIGEHLFTNIPMVADGQGTYRPKAGGTVRAGSVQYLIAEGGWVPLVGITENRPYAITVKGEKHRAEKLANQITLFPGKLAGQDIDWSSLPLEPGDLPDPNTSLSQDCTVNSIDLSLITARIGSTDTASLQIADVNYDNVINGNDVSKVVHTLSTKPDDE